MVAKEPLDFSRALSSKYLRGVSFNCLRRIPRKIYPPRIKTKKAQIKIQQTAFMLIALTLLFAIAGLFVLNFKLAGIKENANELENKNALLLVTKIANSPEFACGGVYGTGSLNCVDFDKIMALKQNIENYKEFWGKGVTNIEIRKIYPKQEKVLCDMKNYPNCNTIQIVSGEIKGNSAENFVSLCRKESGAEGTYDKCEIAKIMIIY